VQAGRSLARASIGTRSRPVSLELVFRFSYYCFATALHVNPFTVADYGAPVKHKTLHGSSSKALSSRWVLSPAATPSVQSQVSLAEANPHRGQRQGSLKMLGATMARAERIAVTRNARKDPRGRARGHQQLGGPHLHTLADPVLAPHREAAVDVVERRRWRDDTGERVDVDVPFFLRSKTSNCDSMGYGVPGDSHGCCLKFHRLNRNGLKSINVRSRSIEQILTAAVIKSLYLFLNSRLDGLCPRRISSIR